MKDRRVINQAAQAEGANAVDPTDAMARLLAYDFTRGAPCPLDLFSNNQSIIMACFIKR